MAPKARHAAPAAEAQPDAKAAEFEPPIVDPDPPIQLAPLVAPPIAARPQPPPVPAPPKGPPPEAFHNLVDLPCVYLQDRGNWPDFKKALHECGLIWNLPEWMTTIVYHGEEWESIDAKGANLDEYFPVQDKKNAGDGNIAKLSARNSSRSWVFPRIWVNTFAQESNFAV
jgi:hypothetical protein